MDEEVELRVPYIESYVPEGRRRPRHVAFWSTLPVKVLRIDDADLRPAYRISSADARSSIRPREVRSFRDALWWPVTVGKVGMTPADFRALAKRGDMDIVEMLGVQTARGHYESRDDFYAKFPYSKIVADTQEQQWARAQRGAIERILFCGDEVLLDAGEPIYYFASYADFVGPALSNRRIKLPPSGDDREWIAHRGAAYGIEEIRNRSAGDGAPFVSEWNLERIEVLGERHRLDGAALACARALVRHLFSRAQLPSVRGARLWRRFDGYFAELVDQDMIDAELCLRVLRAVSLPVPHEERKDLTWEIGAASNILKRLERLSPPALDEADDAALGALGYQ